MSVLKTYPCEASQAAFLPGGIGTGTISIGSRGNLQDFEIFNNPAKNNNLHHTFFSIYVKPEGGQSSAKLLESKLQPPFPQSKGISSGMQGGLPRFASASLCGEYPFAWVDLTDDGLPVHVRLEAFTPFIPLNADDSGIPVAIFRYKVKNTANVPVDVTVAGSLANVTGFIGFDKFQNMKMDGQAENVERDTGRPARYILYE